MKTRQTFDRKDKLLSLLPAIISFDSIPRFQLSLSLFVEEVKLSPEPNEEHEAVDKVEPNPNPALAEMGNQERKKRENKLSVNCI